MLSCNHLWCSVARTTTGCFDQLSWTVGFAQAEVDQFDVIVRVDQDVLRLDVSMRDAVESQVLDGEDQLVEVMSCLVLLQSGQTRLSTCCI